MKVRTDVLHGVHVGVIHDFHSAAGRHEPDHGGYTPTTFLKIPSKVATAPALQNL